MKAKIEHLSSVLKTKLEKLLFLAIIFFIPSQLGKHFWPNFSFISGIRIDYLSPTIYFTDLLILALLILVFIKSFRNGILNKWFENTKFQKMLFLLSSFLAVNTLLSQNIFLSFYYFLKLIEFSLFAYIVVIFISKVGKKELSLTISFAIILQSVISIVQYINQRSIEGVFYFLGERSFSGATPGIANASIDGSLLLRAYGTFSHPNVLGGFLLLFMVFLLFNIKNKKTESILPIAAIIIGSSALILTFSRLSIVLWIISLAIFAVLKIRKGFLDKGIFIFLILAFTIFTAIIYSAFFFRISQTSLSEESFILREALFLDAIFVFLKNPVIGAGMGNFISKASLYGNIYILQPAHNIFLLILIQTGIIGFMVSLWLLYKTYINLLVKKSPYLIMIFFWIIVLGMFDHYFLTVQQGQLMSAFFIGFFWSKNE